MRVAALDEYIRAVRVASRVGREPDASKAVVEISPSAAMWYRLRVTHAADRVSIGDYVTASFGGLQDSAPRAALTSLHARVHGVAPDAWEDPRLVQIWLRWADYLVPRADVGVFTVGTLPRHRPWADALEELADRVVHAVDGGRGSARTVYARLPNLPVRSACATGRVHIRWDTRTTEIVAAQRPSTDGEDARVELARRFLHWHGPASLTQFARWAGTTRADACATWDRLSAELRPVAYAGKARWMLDADVDTALTATRPEGVRLLPAGDPVLHLRDGPRPPPPLAPNPATKLTSRLINSLTGRIFVDGEMVGAWGRVQGDVTFDPWHRLSASIINRVEREAEMLTAALGRPLRGRWLARD